MNAPGQGRPRTPTALKALRGNPGRRPLPDREPVYVLALPEPPKHLDAVAVRRYQVVGEMLLKSGVMTEADMGILAMYAESWSNWIQSSVEVRKDLARQRAIEKQWGGMADVTEAEELLAKRLDRLERRAMQEGPAVRRQREEKLMLDRLGGQLGLSPAMRTRVHATKPETERDPMAELLSG